ncbi:hypothetical protein Shyhy01_17870 [Streptomyces hygroscopicus subsp. hygroscopicus]|nr:hypothetical protein Shyhy01_17870 [Streptomyces hygroscopicus subsp. hygroscopicus]
MTGTLIRISFLSPVRPRLRSGAVDCRSHKTSTPPKDIDLQRVRNQGHCASPNGAAAESASAR